MLAYLGSDIDQALGGEQPVGIFRVTDIEAEGHLARHDIGRAWLNV